MVIHKGTRSVNKIDGSYAEVTAVIGDFVHFRTCHRDGWETSNNHMFTTASYVRAFGGSDTTQIPARRQIIKELYGEC